MEAGGDRARRTVVLLSIALCIVWIYMGLVPKILFPETGEVEMTKGLKLFAGSESFFVTLVGIGEIIFGFVILFVRKKEVHYLNILALVLLASGAMLSKPEIYTFPFSPLPLSVSMIATSWACIINLHEETKS